MQVRGTVPGRGPVVAQADLGELPGRSEGMKRLAFLAALVLLPSPSAHADGCPAATCGVTGSAAPGSRLLVMRPEGPTGPLVAYDVVTATRKFALRAGILAPDGRNFFTVRKRTLERFDARTGRLVAAWGLPGNRFVAAVAPAARAVAVTQSQRDGTPFWLVDGRTGRELGTVEFRGMYQAEALSPDGRKLFLVRWHRDGYDLVHYDFDARRLVPTKLADPDEKMTGNAWSAVATRDGRWLLTLYLKPNNTAFVHALDLRSAVAHCIDLPISGSDPASLGDYALALSPDERTLYLANAAMGNLYVVDLVRLRLARTVGFDSHPNEVSGAAGPNAALSPRGRMLYFSGGWRLVWSYDTAYRKVRGPRAVAAVNYGVPTSVAGLGVTPDGRRLVAVRTDDRVVTLKT